MSAVFGVGRLARLFQVQMEDVLCHDLLLGGVTRRGEVPHDRDTLPRTMFRQRYLTRERDIKGRLGHFSWKERIQECKYIRKANQNLRLVFWVECSPDNEAVCKEPQMDFDGFETTLEVQLHDHALFDDVPVCLTREIGHSVRNLGEVASEEGKVREKMEWYG